MSDTPETDAMSRYAAYGETQIVNASFARRLERERNALKVEAYKYIELWDRATKELESLKSNAQL
jgi:hypothetical protein